MKVFRETQNEEGLVRAIDDMMADPRFHTDYDPEKGLEWASMFGGLSFYAKEFARELDRAQSDCQRWINEIARLQIILEKNGIYDYDDEEVYPELARPYQCEEAKNA